MATFEERRTVIETMLFPLTDEERHTAGIAADRAVQRLVKEPRRSDPEFNQDTVSEYPNWFTWPVWVLLFALLLAASTISIFRVFTSARDHYLVSINEPGQAVAVGIAMFIMAEIAVVISTLAARIFFKDDAWKYAFWVVAVIAAAIAIVGNAQVTRPIVELSLDSIWMLLETFAPPIFVMVTALVAEQLVTEVARQRHAGDAAYQEARNKWLKHCEMVREHKAWNGKYKNALRVAVREKNAKGRGMTERVGFMQSMTYEDWTIVVMRELEADQWFIDEVAANFTEPLAAVSSAQSAGRSRGILPNMPAAPQPASKQDNSID